MRLVAAMVVLLAAVPVRAQSGDAAAAEALFDEGMKLMAAGDYAEACPKLEESQRLDPGVGTLFNLARCYEKTDRLASAWANYLEASQEAERRDEPRRASAARRYAKRLEPRLYRLVILVPKDSRVDGLAIERGGVTVGPGAWGTKVPVDAGELVVSASAPGYQRWETTLAIRGDKKLVVLEIPPLEREPEPAPEPAFDVERIPGEPWYRDNLGWGLVAGAAALAGGATFALLRAGSLESEARGETDLGARDRLFDQADGYGTAGAVLVGAAVAVGVAGAVRLVLSPPDTERRVPRKRGAAAELLVGPGSLGVKLHF